MIDVDHYTTICYKRCTWGFLSCVRHEL